jgi:hypothetical protein
MGLCNHQLTSFSAVADSQVEGLVMIHFDHHQFQDQANSHGHSEGIEYFSLRR